MPGKQPLMLGVVGDSAAGKTTLTQGLATLIGVDDALLVHADDYHRYDRSRRQELRLTALHPDCNYLDIVEQHLTLLRMGQPILKPVYNHRQGTIEAPEYIRPGQFVIVEGLLALYTPAMQRCFDMTIYLEPEETLRRRWKVARDTAERGYTPEAVLASIERRLSDSRTFMQPQKEVADLIISFRRPEDGLENDNAHLNVRILQRHTLPTPDLTDVLSSPANSSRPGLRLIKDIWLGNGPVDILEIEGDINIDEAQALEDALWNQLEFSGHRRPPNIGRYTVGTEEHRSVPLALTQLLIAYYLRTVRRHRPETFAW